MSGPTSVARGTTRRRFVLGALALAASPWARANEGAVFRELRRGGIVILMRHCATEAAGDLPGFSLTDCSTQRNLSERGRADARAIGERLRREKVPIGPVYTSPWCRCRDTAMLSFGHSEDWDPLASLFDFPHMELLYTNRVKQRVASYASRKPAGNVVMVTHNVNISVLTKLSVQQGEMVVVRPDGCCGMKVVGLLQLWEQ